MARTVNNSFSGAKNNILGNAALRYVGFVSAFFGVMMLVLKSNIGGQVMKLIGIVMLLFGVLLCSGNLKLLFSKNKSSEKTKGASLYLLVGVLLVVGAVLLFIFADQVNKWLNLIVGILIALYGLLTLIKFAMKKRSNKVLMVLDLIVAALLIASGIMLALLFKFNGSTYVLATAIVATTAGGLAIILY